MSTQQKVEKIIKEAGFKAVDFGWSDSSTSMYISFHVDIPKWIVEEDEDADFECCEDMTDVDSRQAWGIFKVRISDHDLPEHYAQPHYDINTSGVRECAHCNADDLAPFARWVNNLVPAIEKMYELWKDGKAGDELLVEVKDLRRKVA